MWLALTVSAEDYNIVAWFLLQLWCCLRFYFVLWRIEYCEVQNINMYRYCCMQTEFSKMKLNYDTKRHSLITIAMVNWSVVDS